MGQVTDGMQSSIREMFFSMAIIYIYIMFHACIQVCMYTRCTCVSTYVLYVCTYVRMYVCMYVCTYVCICVYVCMYVCMYVVLIMYIRIHKQMLIVLLTNYSVLYITLYGQCILN